MKTIFDRLGVRVRSVKGSEGRRLKYNGRRRGSDWVPGAPHTYRVSVDEVLRDSLLSRKAALALAREITAIRKRSDALRRD